MSQAKVRAPQTRMTPALFTCICERLAEGESLRAICRDDGMPRKTTVLRWLAQSEAFRAQYAHARELQADALFEEILEIADETQMGEETITRADGSVEVHQGDMLGHRKLRIDARKWIAAKLSPKKYGEKSALELSGKDGSPIIPVLNVTIGPTRS